MAGTAGTPAPAPGADDAQALALLKASGVLDPDATLDQLMDIARQLADLEPAPGAATGAGVQVTGVRVLIGPHFVFKVQT